MSGDVRSAAAELSRDLTPGPYQPMSGWGHAVPTAKREAILTVLGALAPALAVPGGPPAPGEAVIEPNVLTGVQRVRAHLDALHARTARNSFTPTGASQARDAIDTLLVALAAAEERLQAAGD